MEKTAREAQKDFPSLIALRFPNALFEFKHSKVIRSLKRTLSIMIINGNKN